MSLLIVCVGDANDSLPVQTVSSRLVVLHSKRSTTDLLDRRDMDVHASPPRQPYEVCEALVCSRRRRSMMLGTPGSIPTSAKMGMSVAPKASNDSGDSQT